MSISEHKVTSNKKRKIVLIIYILISIVLHYLLADSSFVSDNIQRIVHFLGFVLEAAIRWIFLLAFFFRNEELVSKYKKWKRKGIRFASILLVLIVFCSFIDPFSFTIDYCITWLILIKGAKAENPLGNDLD